MVWRVLRAEGWRAVVRRTLDRLDERVAARARVDGERRARAAPLLNVLGTAPARRLGGLPTQLLARLDEESRSRTIALLHPLRRGYRVQLWLDDTRSAVVLDAPSDLASAVVEAATRVGASAIHLEGTGAIAPRTLRDLSTSPLPLVVSVHDFASWCPTAHLLEVPARRFCAFSADAERCGRCLAATGLADDLAERRAAAARLLGAAAAVVFPSAYLRDDHRALFAGSRAGLERVIEPASAARAPTIPACARPGARPVVAFVGSVSTLKGGHLVEPVARALRARHPALEVHVLGGGDASLLLALRRVPGVEVHGYYRAGTLPARLAHIGANVAVAPSIVPEAFQLTLSECWLAGVPCVVFDHGAAAERIRAHGGGRRVPLDAGASGLVAAIEEVLTDPASRDLGRATASVPSCAAVAGAHLALYAELGLAVSTTPADTTPSKRVDA